MRHETVVDHDEDGDGVWPDEGFTGLWEVLWPNGRTKLLAHYVDGKEHGEYVCYWDNGELAQKGQMRCGECVGKWVDYWRNGVKKETGTYDEGGKHGLWKSYFDDGQIMYEYKYKHGVEHGVFRAYGEEQALRYEGEYRDGSPFNGVCRVLDMKMPAYYYLAEFRNGSELKRRDDLLAEEGSARPSDGSDAAGDSGSREE